MSTTSTDEASQFLAALGQRLWPREADGVAVALPTPAGTREYAQRMLWQIAPLPRVGLPGASMPFRSYKPEHGEGIVAIVELLVDSLSSVYRHDAIKAFLTDHPALCSRSRRNLRAIVHPQNILRPFDPLHTIGRAFRPLFILRPHFDREVARKALRIDFELMQSEERIGGWSKAWFVGLLVTTYICWKWHGEIPVSSEFPGWYSNQPLQQLDDDQEQAELNRILPVGSEGRYLVSEESASLTITELGDDWTRWYTRDIQAYASDSGLTSSYEIRVTRKRSSGRLPEQPPAPRFETYSDWLVATLGLYSGAHDQRLAGEELASCLMTPSETVDQSSNLHEFAAIAASLPEQTLGHLETLFGVLPETPKFVERESPDWGRMMVAIFKDYCRGYDRGKRHGGRDEDARDMGDWKVGRYPIEAYSNAGVSPTVGDLAKLLTTAMPNFRDLTSRAWMFYVDESSLQRLSHPDERGGSHTKGVRRDLQGL